MTELNGPTRLEVAEEAGTIVAATPRLRFSVNRASFDLELSDAAGARVLAPPSSPTGQHRSGSGSGAPFEPGARYDGLTFAVDGALLGSYAHTGRALRRYALTDVQTWAWEGNTLRLRVATNDHFPREASVILEFLDDAVVRLTVELERTDAVVEMGWAAAAADGEGFFGLGERFGRANHRGHEVVNWTEDAPFDPRPGHDWTYWPVPFFLSSRGYGVLLDTTRRAVFRFGSDRSDVWDASVDGDRFSAVFFYGPEPTEVVRRYTALTGRPPMPPPWGLGVWKTTLSGTDAVRAEARRLRDEGLGVSGLWIYDQFDPETNSGWNSAMGYPEGEYPDMPALVSDLHAQGYKVLGYLNPQFINGRPAFEEGVARGYFLKRSDGSTYIIRGPDPQPDAGINRGTLALYDPTNPEGIVWWQDMLRRLLVETGYDGWMHDFGELTPADAVFADGRAGWEIRNLYPTLYHRTGAETCRAVKPDFVFFVRSGYVGSNRWAPAAWPGDQHTDWSPDRGLPGVVPAGLSVGICGTNTWGPDIGGFFDAYDGGSGPKSKELWTRWCQFGALTPIMRDHLGVKRETVPDPVNLWTDEETVETWRRYAKLHNVLVPYLYVYANVAHETGVPTMRHLVLRYPDDPEALSQDHEYLLGDELLVAPVVEEGATTRRVYLPEGGWYDFWDDTIHEKQGYHELPAPLDRIPLFVRGGAILPLLSEPPETLADTAPEQLFADLRLLVYPRHRVGSAVSEFRFHDGSGVLLSEDEGGLRLTLEGTTPERRYTVRLPRGLSVREARVDGETAEGISPTGDGPGWWNDVLDGSYLVRLPRGASEVELRYG